MQFFSSKLGLVIFSYSCQYPNRIILDSLICQIARCGDGVNSIPELELMVKSYSNSGIGIDYLKTNGIDKFGIGIEIKVSYKKEIKSTN